MFGIGGSEILVILVVALLFLGPDKLPDAAKTISKGIRDLKKQSRALQQTIESDEKIGGAIRDLKSALRGEEAPRPVRIQPQAKPAELETPADEPVAAIEEAKPSLTLPATAGEPDVDAPAEDHDDDIGSLIKPASGTVAKSDVQPAGDEPKQKHG
ncbi:MAG TPA: twin-arginine translocase TatA/TatE family subunit [Kofleriaceae bacterium]|nr:twin-arginine translocase TatA/TatE family subunit [Kofleriaceae bacterium]